MNQVLKLSTLTFLLTLSSASYHAQAQEAVRSSDFARNSIFLELGGNGLLYSLNYDHKFFDHASARIGGMYLPLSADDPSTFDGRISMIFVPIMANYLVGNGNSRLEIGGGVTVVRVDGGGTVENEQIDDFRGAGAVFTGTIGYRLQPRNGGFLFRIGFTPLFAPDGFLPWAGLSLGATF